MRRPLEHELRVQARRLGRPAESVVCRRASDRERARSPVGGDGTRLYVCVIAREKSTNRYFVSLGRESCFVAEKEPRGHALSGCLRRKRQSHL